MHVKQNGSWCFHVAWRWCGGKAVWHEALSYFSLQINVVLGSISQRVLLNFCKLLQAALPLLPSSWALCSLLQGESLKENVSRNYITKKQISRAVVKQKKGRNCVLDKCIAKRLPQHIRWVLSLPREQVQNGVSFSFKTRKWCLEVYKVLGRGLEMTLGARL